jgi:CheY-like chemotaxis protein
MPAAIRSPVATAAAFGAASSTLADRRILIVEDNCFVADQCESALIEAGYEVVDIVTTADDAIRVALERRPRLILMDIYLPGKRDGVNAAIEIRERCGIRSIFFSVLVDAGDKARADAARPLAWLAKPFTIEKLVATIESAIGDLNASLERAVHPLLTPNSGATDKENALPLGPESQGPGGSAAIFHDIVAEFTASKGSAPVLAALALTEVWRGVITGEGPTASGRVHFSRTIDAEDTALCRRILIAAGGPTGTPVSREEVDILIDIQEAAIERKDNGAFDELFAKAIAHHMIAAAGRAVPPRPVALASEIPLRSWASPADFETVDREIAAWIAPHLQGKRRFVTALGTIATTLIGARAAPVAVSIANVLDRVV